MIALSPALCLICALVLALQPVPSNNPSPTPPGIPFLSGTIPLLSPQDDDHEAIGIRSFRILHADANEVTDLIQRLLDGEYESCVTDERSQQVFIRADQGTLARAQELIQALDQPVINESPLETVMLTPRYRRAEDLHDLIKLHASRKGKMVIDESRNMIILNETPLALAQIRDLVANLDQPVADLAIHFLVLGHSDEPLPPLPRTPSMAKIEAELSNLGLSGYGVLSRAVVVTQENDDFSVNGVNDSSALTVQGSIHLLHTDDKAQLNLDVEVSVTETDGRAAVSTTVKVPLNHQMILGISPAGGSPGKPLVLVAEARRL